MLLPSKIRVSVRGHYIVQDGYVINAKELALLLFTRQVDKSPYSHDLEVDDSY